MTKIDLNELNPKQREAVLHTEGPLLLLSGAGSGKTKVITYRIAHIIEMGVPQYNILAITFTNKAAKEMAERANKLLGGSSQVSISTFHALCIRLIRPHMHLLGYESSFTIYDGADSERLIKDCIKELNLNDKMYQPRSMAGAIGDLKDNLTTPVEFEKQVKGDIRQETISKIYTLYQKKLKENNALDFDDIIMKTLELFKQEKEILESYQERYRYIMVDEYQDTNYAQYTLVNMLSQKHGNLCVVGDDDQSIYGWRGADIRNILDFEKDFKNAKVIKLEQNYRCSGIVLDAANSVIANNMERKSKRLWTEKAKGEKINYISVDSDRDEAAFIVKTIKEQNRKLSDIAILYRQNSLSRTIEDYLVRENIPYKVFGGLRFYDRKEIKDIISYVKLIYNTKDSMALKRIINVPKRGIGAATVEKIDFFAAEHGFSFYDTMRGAKQLEINVKYQKLDEFAEIIENLRDYEQAGNKVSELIKKLVHDIKYELEMDGDDITNASRWDNINELINKAVEYEGSAEVPSLAGFLEEVSLVADIDSLEDEAGYVTLMTLHSSKGLEFPVVIIPGFEEGIFPSSRSILDPSGLEEERRLCYVGITRAIERVYLSSSRYRLVNGKPVYASVSRFLKEIEPSLVEDITYKNMPSRNIGVKKSSDAHEEMGIVKKAYTSTPNQMASNYKNTIQRKIPAPKDKTLSFEVGDMVKHNKYGEGEVMQISPAGPDYEVTVDFDGVQKKFMAFLSNIQKV